MKVLVIGLGSIAKKHINALRGISPDAVIFALRSGNKPEHVENVTNISTVSNCPEVNFVIISNPTALHADAIKEVIHLKKPLFIEKPPFHTLEQVDEILRIVSDNNIVTYTAFNLRFLDCLIYLKNNIDIRKVQEVNVYCGSYLPNWRPDSDYKKSYSANAQMGGGVHLDLIHELDYVVWLFGKPMEVKSVLRNKSKLDISAVDYANYALTYPGFVVNIVLNYYRRDTKRSCEIVFEDVTWNTNLIKNSIVNTEDNTLIFQSNQSVLDTYKSQMEYFCKTISNHNVPANSLFESVDTLKIALS